METSNNNRNTTKKVRVARTKDQHRAELDAYLRITSQHLFRKEDGSTMRTAVDGDTLVIVRTNAAGEVRTETRSIEQFFKYHGSNSKCVMSHLLFLGQGYSSARRNKYVDAAFQEALELRKKAA